MLSTVTNTPRTLRSGSDQLRAVVEQPGDLAETARYTAVLPHRLQAERRARVFLVVKGG